MKTEIVKLLSNGVNQGEFNCVNSGGCGVFAVAINNVLASYGIKSNIVLVAIHGNYSKNSVKKMIAYMGAENINHAYTLMLDAGGRPEYNTQCGHIAVEVDGINYDGNGVCHDKTISEPIHVNVMSRMCRNPAYWNSSFELCNDNSSNIDDDGRVTLASIIRAVNKHVKSKIKEVM